VAQITQGAEKAQGDQVLGRTLAESEAGIQDQLLRRDAKRAAACRDRRHLV